jgi:NAD(P)-dependent dehydrogenase (short-subunit alcohol dehydrogenase family)
MRELLTFAVLVSLGGCEPQVAGHVAANLDVGSDRARLLAVLTHDTGKVTDLVERHPGTFRPEVLDMTDTQAVREVVDRAFARLGRIDVVVSNAGYGLFGAAEELSDAQVEHILATNPTSSIQLIRAVLPHLRAQGGGRVIQISSCDGQVAHLNPVYDDTPAHGFLAMLDPANGVAPGDPAHMAARIIASVDTEPARCASCSAPRPSSPRSPPSAHTSATSSSRPSSPPPPTSRPASDSPPFGERRAAWSPETCW